MKLQFLGTGATEGIPCVFCQCEICKTARLKGGKYIRHRSCAILNDCIAIDLPADFYMQSNEYKIDMANIEYVVNTHPHSDHLSKNEISHMHSGYDHRLCGKQFCIAGGTDTIKALGNMYEYEFNENQPIYSASGLTFRYIKPFEKAELCNEISAYLLPANHAKNMDCRIILFEDNNGKRLLYATDTGYFKEETIEFLKNKKCDVIILDGTYGFSGGPTGDVHMGLEADINMKNKLTENGTADSDTQFYTTHFTHNGFFAELCRPDLGVHPQEELEELSAKNGITVAYDGLIINC